MKDIYDNKNNIEMIIKSFKINQLPQRSIFNEILKYIHSLGGM